MKTFKIFVAKEAELFLSANYDYLYALNPIAANKWLDGITRKINELTTFPNKGAIIPEAENEPSLANLHQIFYSMSSSGSTFRIIYTVEDDVFKIVNIITIRSSSQEPIVR